MMVHSGDLNKLIQPAALETCLSSTITLLPRDQTHCGLVTWVLGILTCLLCLPSVVGWAIVTGLTPSVLVAASLESSVVVPDAVTLPLPLEPACPHAGTLGNLCLTDSKSS
jgi:hypothetical protein